MSVIIPVVDLFAGPGGLGEGFSAFQQNGRNPFDIRLSIERDKQAHKTLLLRSFYRKVRGTPAFRDYLRRYRDRISTDKLFELHLNEYEQAKREAWHAELGGGSPSVAEIRDRVRNVLKRSDHWLLIGGPPCQAYSLAGRSRNKGIKGYSFEADKRSKLYVEYLQFIGDHRPSVFVMENVKGLLSARFDGEAIFQRIKDDLQDPARALRREGRQVLRGHSFRYRLATLHSDSLFESGQPTDFLLKAEDFGIPQARHRVIIVGIRDDLRVQLSPLARSPQIPIEAVLADLPPLRSGLSEENDTTENWLGILKGIGESSFMSKARKSGGDEVASLIQATLDAGNGNAANLTRGARFVESTTCIQHQREWFVLDGAGGVCNHETRSHISSDLHRYIFAASFAAVHQRSPELADFPKELLPRHRNVQNAMTGGNFADRFRVQRRGRPSSTITSHIAKDGHYYIHYDPQQCRSLTVREAARVQTFPDSYIFEGPRTEQYAQVGNAVPPLLAYQIAKSIFEIMR
jgi:DNA (cytosine-5)-methyltransferase 1